MEYHDLVKLYYKDKLEYKETYEKRYHGEETKRFDFDVSGNPAFGIDAGDSKIKRKTY